MVNTARLLGAVAANEPHISQNWKCTTAATTRFPRFTWVRHLSSQTTQRKTSTCIPSLSELHHFFHRAKGVWYDAKGKEHHLKQFETKVDWASCKSDYGRHFKVTVTLKGHGWFGTVTEAFCVHRGWMLLAWQNLTGEPLSETTEKEYKAMTNQIKKPKAQTAKAKKSDEEDFVDGTSEARGTKSQKKTKMELHPDSVERMIKKPEPSKQKKGWRPKVRGDDDESDSAFTAKPGLEKARVMTARFTGTPRKPSHKSKTKTRIQSEDEGVPKVLHLVPRARRRHVAKHGEAEAPRIWGRYLTGKWDNCLRSKRKIERVQDAIKIIYPEPAIPSLASEAQKNPIALVEVTQAWRDFKNESIPSRRGRVTIDWSACRKEVTSNPEPSSDSSSDDDGYSDSEEAKSEDEAPEPARKKQRLYSVNVKLLGTLTLQV
ncbi:hypothetical protein LTR17_014142 [Elasticomyces elasticus]|nr:hypothetical protein LTR17_014142 [Elasticomyces elasticus]